MLKLDTLRRASIFDVTEDLDGLARPRFVETMALAEAAGERRVVVSLRDCGYCESVFLSIFLQASKRLGPRFFVVVPPGTACRRIFELSGFMRLPFIVDSIEEALDGPGSSDPEHLDEAVQ